MAEFNSWHSYADFRESLIYDRRFFHTAQVKNFLISVKETSIGREQEMPSGTIFWRAQLGCGFEPIDSAADECGGIPCPYPAVRMKPRNQMATEGRANPKGLPCLYGTLDKEVAMAEVRPWIGSYISLAQLRSNRKLKILTFASTQVSRTIYLEEPDPKEREKEVWLDIDRAFSKPVTNDDETAEYVPTQILAELFRSEGFDGIAYRSSLVKGQNLAFFDVSSADVINISLFEAKEVHFRFEECANPHFVQMKKKKRRRVG